ncbi:MAG TPA: twin-arginine translocation signal domain-containing protein, partial [Candidatus Binatia bacterium]|nr:twin-arginine translocation signal domain-containing protein [Candidatus Binatia bacterium]
MASKDRTATAVTPEAAGEDVNSQPSHEVPRRSFLKGMGVAGVALSAGAVLPSVLNAQGTSSSITTGDAAILRFLAAAEILETDLWLQYQEIGGIQDAEVSKLASQFIPGYPALPTGGNSLYMQDLIPLDSDMSQYIHDNTEDELTHEVWINNYLVAHGAAPANLDQFR